MSKLNVVRDANYAIFFVQSLYSFTSRVAV